MSAVPDSDTFVVEVREHIDDIDLEQWDEVIAAAGAPVFYSSAFLRAYERVPLQPTYAFCYVLLRSTAAHRPVAVLPAYVQDAEDAARDLADLDLPGRSAGDRILITHVTHCYDTCLPALRLSRGLVAATCEALASLAVRHGVKWFAFVDVDGSSELAHLLIEAGLDRQSMETRFRQDVSGFASVDDYIPTVTSARARRNLRVGHRKGLRAGLATALRRPAHEGLDAVVGLCRGTTARNGSAGYYPEELEDFMRAAGDIARVLEVRLGERLAAGALILLDEQRFHLWAGGLDYDLAAEGFSVYLLLFHEMVSRAIASGCPTMELGRGQTDFKLRHALQPTPLFAFVGRPAPTDER